MTDLSIRVMDVDTNGVDWSSPQEVTILLNTETASQKEIAAAVNRANWEFCTNERLAEDEQAPGEVLQAAGNERAGIFWLEEEGRTIVIQWRRLP